MFVEVLGVLLVAHVQLSSGFGAGAPASRCVDMIPHHNNNPFQSGPPPYAIITPPTYAPGQPITVQLQGQRFFHGFLIQARTSTNDITGTMQTMPGEAVKIVNCGMMGSGGVTHINKRDKTIVKFQWIPPADLNMPIVFFGTVVQSYTTFWRVNSRQLRFSPVITLPPPVVTQPPIVVSQLPTQTTQLSTLPPPVTIPISDTVTSTVTEVVTEEQTAQTTKAQFVPPQSTPKSTASTPSLPSSDLTVPTIIVSRQPSTTANNEHLKAVGLPLLPVSTDSPQTSAEVQVQDITSTAPTLKTSTILRSSVTTTQEMSAPDRQLLITTQADLVTSSSDKQPGLVPGKITYDPGCGNSKGCFVDCGENGCNYFVSWRDIGNAVEFEMHGKAAGDSYIAIGFSSDDHMGDDSVTECVSNNNDVRFFNSWNDGHFNDRSGNETNGLAIIDAMYIDGVLRCKFKRAKAALDPKGLFNLEGDWYMMFARGPAYPGYEKSQHAMRAVSSKKIDLQSMEVVGRRKLDYPLVKAHGCLMILAWVLFTGIGIVVARYYKTVWQDKTFLKLKIWFQIHRSVMAIAFVLDVIAFIIIFIDVKGYSKIHAEPGRGYLKSHPILGIIITALVIANPIMALFRPGPNSKRRPIFNWAHWTVGVAAYVLSAICICFGFQLHRSSTPDYAINIMIGYVVYIIVFDVVLEIFGCLEKRKETKLTESVEMKSYGNDTNNIPNGKPAESKKKSKDTVKTALLVSHVAITGAFALVLVLVVALS